MVPVPSHYKMKLKSRQRSPHRQISFIVIKTLSLLVQPLQQIRSLSLIKLGTKEIKTLLKSLKPKNRLKTRKLLRKYLVPEAAEVTLWRKNRYQVT